MGVGMSKYTPGPWKVAAIPGAVIAMDNTTIAKVFYGERSVCDANARLIAAAPEQNGALLLARTTLRSQLSGHFPKALDSQRRAELEALAAVVDAAIDKAEGET